MNEITTLFGIVIVLGSPVVVFVAIVRRLLGDQPMSLFASGADLPWPRGVQEQDAPRWTFDAVQEPPIALADHRSKRRCSIAWIEIETRIIAP